MKTAYNQPASNRKADFKVVKRLIGIARARFRGLRPIDALRLARESLFCNESIDVYEYDIRQAERIASDSPGQSSIRRGSVEDLARNSSRFDPPPWEFQCHIYDRVKEFYVAVSERREIEHISWVYYTDDPNRFISLRSGEAEIKYCLTLPECRGRGLYPRVLKTIASQLLRQGVRRVFICVNADNHASIRGVMKAGFVRVDRVRVVKVFGIQVSKRWKSEGPGAQVDSAAGTLG